MGSPQTLTTGMTISYYTLRGMPLHCRCVVLCFVFFVCFVFFCFVFFCFSMQRHRQNPHGHRQKVPKHPTGTETNKEIQTPTSCSQWILLVDLRPGTRFGAYDKLIHDLISMHAFKLNMLNINGIHPACRNAALGTLTWSRSIVPV